MDHAPHNLQWPEWLDLDVERKYWQLHFDKLPCAKAGDSFDHCWPMIELVYVLFVRHPRITLQEALGYYEAGSRGREHGMTQVHLTELFARLWGRILKVADGRAIPVWVPGTAQTQASLRS
ncbi:MAG: hypothetical protein ABWX87_01040 [Pseudoxanthomonas sp.]|jgi:hypothetical protein